MIWSALFAGRRQQKEEQERADMEQRLEARLSDLTREKAFLSAILAALEESVVAVDHAGRILFINTAAERLFGVKSEEVRGRAILEGLRHSLLNDVLNQTLATRQPLTQEISVHAPTEHLLSARAIPVDYGQGQPGVLVALHDVTELRKLENVRRDFVANVTHELKTPLTSIKGYAETLLDGAINDPAHSRPFVQTIQEQAETLSRLIDDVLDLSAIEAQRVSYRFEPIALQEIVSRVIKNLEPLAKAKQVTLHARVPDNVPPVRADREKLVQIVVNLLDNAIKFNKPGGEVRVNAEVKDSELIVRIQDTGRGIVPEDLPRVFERFYRGNKDRSHDIPGTGLGLAIVKHLLEAHQGTVTAQSTLGQGSVFQFSLPLASR